MRDRERSVKVASIPVLAVAILAVLIISGCAVVGGASKAVQNAGESDEGTTGTSSTTETTTEATSEAPTTQQNARANENERTDARENPPGNASSGPSLSEEDVVLSLRGESGTGFDLSCRVGEEREESSGEVPKRLVFTPEKGQSVECVVRKKDAGSLRAAMISGDDRTIRQTNSENATITFVYRDGAISGETLSTPSSGSVRSSQSSSVTRSSSESSIRSSQSVSITD